MRWRTQKISDYFQATPRVGTLWTSAQMITATEYPTNLLSISGQVL